MNGALGVVVGHVALPHHLVVHQHLLEAVPDIGLGAQPVARLGPPPVGDIVVAAVEVEGEGGLPATREGDRPQAAEAAGAGRLPGWVTRRGRADPGGPGRRLARRRPTLAAGRIRGSGVPARQRSAGAANPSNRMASAVRAIPLRRGRNKALPFGPSTAEPASRRASPQGFAIRERSPGGLRATQPAGGQALAPKDQLPWRLRQERRPAEAPTLRVPNVRLGRSSWLALVPFNVYWVIVAELRCTSSSPSTRCSSPRSLPVRPGRPERAAAPEGASLGVEPRGAAGHLRDAGDVVHGGHARLHHQPDVEHPWPGWFASPENRWESTLFPTCPAGCWCGIRSCWPAASRGTPTCMTRACCGCGWRRWRSERFHLQRRLEHALPERAAAQGVDGPDAPLFPGLFACR